MCVSVSDSIILCIVAICSGGCGNGYCSSPGTCSCNSGWSGSTCSTRKKHIIASDPFYLSHQLFAMEDVVMVTAHLLVLVAVTMAGVVAHV